jgi:hypothetical protein
MNPQQKESIWKYYHEVWSQPQVSQEMTTLLAVHGFSPKSSTGTFEIGNKHGEVYAYPSEKSELHEWLNIMMINPTGSGKLSIKLTLHDAGKRNILTERITKAACSARQLGKPEVKKDGKCIVEYLFLEEAPPENHEDAGRLLLDTTKSWLNILTIS